MSLAIAAEHRALADTARAWVGDRCPPTVRRAALDADPGARPGFWAEMAELGWLGLHLDPGHGGAGAGMEALGVVLEQLGRGLVPGPFVPTTLASAVIDRLGDDEQRREWLAGLAEGSVTAAVAFASDPVAASADADEAVTLEGSWTAVSGAAAADWLVLPVTIAGQAEWVVVDAAAVNVELDPSLDLLRRTATVSAAGVVAERARRLRESRSVVAELAALVLCAEALGVGQWCVDAAALYATQRVQFGRPIGQFQGVKHRCADMLAALELARAAVWDGLRERDPGRRRLAVATAAAATADAVVGIAQDCVQIHGGIGFTWEHDAHLYLRRALATRSLLPTVSTWRASALAAARTDAAAVAPAELPAEAEPYRAEVREWLERLVTGTPKTAWNDAIAASGYLVPHWPAPWGRDAGPAQQLAIDHEFVAARVRRPHLQVAGWALPTLIAHGTPAQQERWMGPSMRLELRWCQLFSEPEAGSDLAALRTKAVRDGDGWRLTGQKVWTSMAAEADWGICLARTDPDRPKHEGITCFFVDMHRSGIEIRPLTELTGAAWFNEVFLDDVFVPDDCVIGAVDDGWRVGRTTLANERVSMGSGASLGSGVRALVDLLDAKGEAGAADVDVVGRLLVTDHALAALRTRMTLRALDGADAGPESSIAKLLGVLHDQEVQSVGLSLLGPAAATAAGDVAGWVHSYLWNRCLTIAGGTSEVQRNVIAERLLGLPRDP